MKRKIVSAIAIIFILMILGGSLGAYYMLGRMKKTELPKDDASLGIQPRSQSTGENGEGQVQPVKKRNVTNIVFFGLDDGKSDGEVKSDSIIVVSIDKDNNEVKLSSIMRDLYVEIPDSNEFKINSAYYTGGPLLAIKVINTNFDLDIRDYVTVNFSGLEKLIDKVGGVPVKLTSAEAALVPGGKAGLNTLNGKQALAYSRIRKVGHADFERTQRQRTVLNELFKKIKAQGILKLPGIINSMLPYVETSLSKGDILSIAQTAMGFNTDKIQQLRIPIDGTYKDGLKAGIYILIADIQKNKEKLHEFIYGN